MKLFLFVFVFGLTVLCFAVDSPRVHGSELELQSPAVHEPGYPREAYHWPTVVAQSIVGALPLAISTAFFMIPDAGNLTEVFFVFGAIGLVSAPIIVPMAVNMTGNFLHYREQYVGSYLGMVVGLTHGLLLSMGLRKLGVENELLGGALPYSVGIVAGSVVGYHHQANLRYRRVFDARLGPTLIPDRDGTHNLGMAIQGRF